MLLLLLLVSVSADYIGKEYSYYDRETLRKHPMHAVPFNQNVLKQIAREEWVKISQMCPSLRLDANIDIAFDYSLVDTDYLAWNSHSLMLQGGILMPTQDMTIGVNPEVQNGWHLSENCSNITYQYDLRTVLRHELIHGIGMGSSIIKRSNIWYVGQSNGQSCYPRLYDTLIEDSLGDKIIDGCSFSKSIQSRNIYINGVKLYNPIFYDGSSISHHVYSGELMYKALPYGTCIPIASNEFKILSALGLDCPGSAQPLQHHAILLLMPLVLFVFFL